VIEALEKRLTAMTAAEVAEVLKLSKQQVYRLAASGGLGAFTIGSSVRFDPQELARALRETGR